MRKETKFYVMGRDMDLIRGTQRHFPVGGPYKTEAAAERKLSGMQDFGDTESYVDYFIEER